MSSDVRKDMIPYLEVNGFEFKRGTGKHDVYSDGQINFILPTGKVTSWRAFDYLRTELRRKCKQVGRPFIDLRYSHQEQKEKKVFNSPRIEGQAPTPPRQLELASAEGRPRPLDKEALEHCKKGKEAGKGVTSLAKELSEKGYTAKRGGPLTQSVLSQFLVANGVRYVEPYTKGGKEVTPAPAATEKAIIQKRQLDKEALEFCKMAFDENWSQQRMADALNQMGYITITGLSLDNNHVSKFLRDNGMRRTKEYTRGAESQLPTLAPAAIVPQSVVQGSKIVDDVRSLVNSKMPVETLERMLIMYFKNVR